MKKILLLLVFTIIGFPVFGADLEWFTDANAALEKAKAENKLVVLDFTGSDWCIWCKRLKSEVFDQPEFAEFARINFVMVEVDFPRAIAQRAEQMQANAELAKRFNIQGFPTLIFLNGAGVRVADSGYIEGGAKRFIAEVERIPGVRRVEAPVAEKAEPEPPPRKPAPYVPIAPTPPIRYSELALKGISGTKEKRMALINNETLQVGETAKVKLRDGRVEVVCKEIRDDSVLVTVDGKLTELKLGGRK